MTLFENDLGASLMFTFVFLASIAGLLFLLAWLEQAPAERWRPRWWVRWREAAERPGTGSALQMSVRLGEHGGTQGGAHVAARPGSRT